MIAHPRPHGFRVEPTVGAVCDARRRLARTAREWGLLGELSVRDLELCASEVLTNAYVHTGESCSVTMRWTGAAVRVEVTDASTDFPHEPRPGQLADSRLGVTVLGTIATAWGIDPLPHGKTVWFEIAPESRHETGGTRLAALVRAAEPRVPSATRAPSTVTDLNSLRAHSARAAARP